MSMKFTQQNFQQEVLESKEPVLIDFYADWCAPCKMIAPIVEEIAGEVSGVKVGKVNVDEEPGLAGEFRVMSIPTLVVMKDGKPVKTIVGVQPKKEILNMLEL
jgi:thioredoxin 1